MAKTPISTVALISKPGKPELAKALPELLSRLSKAGVRALVDPETAAYVPDQEVVARTEIADRNPDLVIVLGGDGTLLAAARAVARTEIPLLAVNLGSLGFLTEVPMSELYATFEAMQQNRGFRDSRAMLQCQVKRREETVAEYLALNDVVVTKSAIARIIEVDVAVNGSFVSNFKADGVIVSTPTGSTAYSLAAGGPVLEPTVDAFVITPVSPHALTNRPIVLKDSSEITMSVRESSEPTTLTVDGQVGMQLLDGDRILCCKSKHKVHLVRMPGRSFFDVLRTKLKWGER
jgi:NAD+ kinase